MSKETNQVEDIFKQAFENYEVDAGSNAWQAIKAKMAAESAVASSASTTTAASTSSSWVATAIVATVISATAVGGYFFFNDTAEKIKGKEQQTETIVESKPSEAIEKQANNIVDKKVVDKDIQQESVENDQSNQATQKKNRTAEVKQKAVPTVVTENDENVKADENASSKGHIDTSTQITETADGKEGKNSGFTKEQSNAKNQAVSNSTKEVESGKQPVAESTDQKSNTTSPSPTSNEIDTEKRVEAPDFSSIPNVFSPNQDGINDEFVVEIENVDKFHIQILNQSGKMVFESLNMREYWKGDLPNGSLAPEGFYVYRILVEKEGKMFSDKGGFNLTR